MEWGRYKGSWPNAAHSRFVHVPPHKWHVQEMGQGPKVLFLHGAGGSTHSWAGIFEDLARDHHVLALDLPGQGFTKMGRRDRSGLPEMTQDIDALLAELSFSPDVIVGHSAGAAIAVSLAHKRSSVLGVMSINGAFESFEGVAGILFPVFAKILALNPATGPLVSMFSSNNARVRKLIASTGSAPFDAQISRYRALISSSAHVSGTLAMMSQWSLAGMDSLLSNIKCPVLFLTGEADGAVPPSTSKRAMALTGSGVLRVIPEMGHLMHEEKPEWVAETLREFSRETCRLGVTRRGLR